MPLTPTQIAALKTELQTDPQALGYNAVARNDTAMSDEINFVRDGVTPCPDNAVVGRTAAITAATNATPVVITSTAHGLVTGDSVVISGVLGNLAANGTWTVTRVNNNTFSLNGSAGTGAYTSGGAWTWAVRLRNQQITTQALLGAIDNRDLITNGSATAITGDQYGKLMLFGLIAQDGAVTLTNADGSDNQNLHTIKQALNNTNGSQTTVIALSQRFASRSEMLFGTGAAVTIEDIGTALNN